MSWADSSEYPTAGNLIDEIQKVVPDSLNYLIHDMFETITLFENRTRQAFYVKRSSGQYEVTLHLETKKIQADSTGGEISVPMRDWIDVGIYGRGKDGKEKLLYLRKHKFEPGQTTLHLLVNERPTRAGIDPFRKLIDRNTRDNVIQVDRLVPLSSLPITGS
jgi:hypothetical protein